MKVRDLLIKIVNGEDLPQKIKINKTIYELKNINDLDELYVEKGKPWNYYNFSLIGFYDNEVEILEEEKKIPEKLPDIRFENGKFYLPINDKQMYILREIDKVFLDKINSIIDYLKSKGDE